MNSRDQILNNLRKNAPQPRVLPRVPLFEDDLPPAINAFRESLKKMGGTWADLLPNQNLDAAIRSLFPDAKVICSATQEVAGTRRAEYDLDQKSMNDVDVGVVRAAIAVAETGSIWLSERQLGTNSLGYLAQHLVALVDPDDIVGNLHQAYQYRGFREARYAVLMSGPSATADIEGVLIKGAQGIRSLTVLPVKRPKEDFKAGM
jgi:L-lactate dehydrogenase complex protein LldG